MIVIYIIVGIILFGAVCLGILFHVNGSAHRRFVEAANHALQRSFDNDSLPALTVGSSYGFPTFKVAFETRAKHQHAVDSGAVSRFMTELDSLCQGKGRKDNPFDLKKAVYCTDPEKEAALAKWIAEESKKTNAKAGTP